MKVVTINGNGTDMYDVAIHKVGCPAAKRAIMKDGFPRDYFVEEIDTKREHWLDYNYDFINEGGEDNAWPMHFHACTEGLPDGGDYGQA